MVERKSREYTHPLPGREKHRSLSLSLSLSCVAASVAQLTRADAPLFRLLDAKADLLGGLVLAEGGQSRRNWQEKHENCLLQRPTDCSIEI